MYVLDYMGLSRNMRIKDIKVDKILLEVGNGRIEDLKAETIKGKISKDVNAMVVPGSD